jgi:hypothetical protein
MIPTPRRRPTGALAVAVLASVLALVAVACGSTTPSAAPSTSSPSVAPIVTVAPTASPAASASATPVASPSAATACPVQAQTGVLPSDRVTDLKASSGATADTLTFVFGPASLGSPAGAAKGSLAAAKPPYTSAGSGAALQIAGQHVVQIRFTGMSLQNDAGEEIYKGPQGIEEPFPALRNAVVYDASEGVIGWYVGYDGPGCVTLTRAGNNVVLSFAHD